ncbi:hypothetical protein I3842_01G082700 [Carya illinoinensis]|uniref:Protein kinase domain-containing protein n=1 Tax=Carya illinoinensis TaxID=32201 RepID=A0A922K3D8_CARIL|nr:hypothetical protein I3842_01G082700 [Carya illinoinensis]
MFPLLFGFVIILGLLKQLPVTLSLPEPQKHEQAQTLLLPTQCNEKCGSLHIPFPFYLNTSCGSVSDAFHLSCSNSTIPFLNIASESYRILEFFSDGVLVDFPGPSSCRQYNDLRAFSFSRSNYFSVSVDNVIGLYDCEDSSLCKAECETINMPGCDGSDTSPACCYPLSDHSIWHIGDGFTVFSKFGCRGFGSWAVLRGANAGKRGVKLEWAIPRNSSRGACASNGYIVNATGIEAGVRCLCQDGFSGDGFANGVGCLKSCIKDGREAFGTDCYNKQTSGRKVVIVAGVLASVLIVASLTALLYLIKRHVKQGKFDTDQAYFHSTISFRKACRTRLFTYHELDRATKGFEKGQTLADSTNGSIYAGILGDRSHIAVLKLHCDNERDILQVLSQIEVLSLIQHRNMAHLLGCCIDAGYAPLVVYEYPANGTLEEHLLHSREHNIGLDWYKRLHIAAETASVLSFLQSEISPPIYHHYLRSSCLFLDDDFSVKIAGLGLLTSSIGNGSDLHKSDVYNLGVLLLEIISGSNHFDTPTVALHKMKCGKLEEIVDPFLYYHEQPPFRREQIEIVADLATRCLLFGRDGKLGMMDVARELVHITKESIDGSSKRGPALEETFSNSSLLQMISMSPDSIHVP